MEDANEDKRNQKRAAVVFAAAVVVVGGVACKNKENSSNGTVRKNAEEIKQENQVMDIQDSDTEESAGTESAAESRIGEGTEEKRTEYPLTITTYGYDGAEITTVYEKAPEKVMAVYQGNACIGIRKAVGGSGRAG